MFRKSTAGAAAIGAAMLLAILGAEPWSANAWAATPANAASGEGSDSAGGESVSFVSNEVVQPLPAGDTESTATSLGELVRETPKGGTLSEDMRCLAGAVYFESRGEPLAGQLAVAQVVINRAESGQFPSSYCGVVFQRAQFSFVRNGQMPAINTDSPAWLRAKAIARVAHQGLWDSKAADSLYFHAKYVHPRWSYRKERLAVIDSHVFYR